MLQGAGMGSMPGPSIWPGSSSGLPPLQGVGTPASVLAITSAVSHTLPPFSRLCMLPCRLHAPGKVCLAHHLSPGLAHQVLVPFTWQTPNSPSSFGLNVISSGEACVGPRV